MTDKLAEIEARWAKATPGPWEVVRQDVGDEDFVYVPVGITSPTRTIVASEGGLAPDETWSKATLEADATAIAAAPNDIAWLVAELKRLRSAAPHAEAGR